MRASALLRDAWEAVGGDAWRSVETLRRDTELLIGGAVGRTVTWWAAPDKFAHEAELGESRMRVCTDGVRGWVDGRRADDTAVLNWRTYAYLISNRYLLPGAAVTPRLIGTREIDEHEANVVEVRLPFGSTVTCSFDRKEHWLVREFSHHSAPGIDNLLLESFYGDYRRVGNVVIPFRCGEIVPQRGGGVVQSDSGAAATPGFVAELRVTRVTLNETLPANTFGPTGSCDDTRLI